MSLKSYPTFLCLETSTLNCSVAVFRGEECISLVEEFSDKYIHGEVLHLFIQKALGEAKISVNDLDAVAVSKGPGSYTGLRIGVSAAKGICFALNIPLFSVNSLRVLAEATTDVERKDSQILSVIDARRMEVYSAIFDTHLKSEGETQAEIVEPDTFENRRRNRMVLVGDAQEKLRGILTPSHYLFTEHIYPSAQNMGAVVYQKIQDGCSEDVAYFEPYYLKDFVAGIPKKSPLLK